MANEKATTLVNQSAQLSRIQRPGTAGNGQQAEFQPYLSPYLCRWCRNGRSLNEAHENCLAAGKFDRFWPVADAAIGHVPPFPIREVAAGKLSSQETRVIVYFYLWLATQAHKEPSS